MLATPGAGRRHAGLHRRIERRRTATDWWSLSRQAQALKRQRVEDYVSAAAAVNGPLVPEEPGSSRVVMRPEHRIAPSSSIAGSCAAASCGRIRSAAGASGPHRCAAERADPLTRCRTAMPPAWSCSRAVTDSSAPVGQRHVLRRRPAGVHRHRSGPFECEWDAGHEVDRPPDPRRVQPPGRRPGRADACGRKGLGFADKVNVEVVQVTVTVTDDRRAFRAGHSALGVPGHPRTASRRRSPISRLKTCRSS